MKGNCRRRSRRRRRRRRRGRTWCRGISNASVRTRPETTMMMMMASKAGESALRGRAPRRDMELLALQYFSLSKQFNDLYRRSGHFIAFVSFKYSSPFALFRRHLALARCSFQSFLVCRPTRDSGVCISFELFPAPTASSALSHRRNAPAFITMQIHLEF